jgi:hypothetical protein
MKNYVQLSRNGKTQFWQNHFDCWKGSNLSQKKYCENNSLSYWNFKTRYSKSKSDSVKTTRNFIKLKAEKINSANSSKIEILFSDRIKIIVEESISEGNLGKIFSAMRHTHD